MTENLTIVMAQTNMTVGDIDGNTDKIIDWAHNARDQHGADLVLFPELAICGYPPEDLIFRDGFDQKIRQAIKRLQREVHDIAIIVGYPEKTVGGSFNKASLIHNGSIVTSAYKRELPNYGVFDENRYFVAGNTPCVFSFHGWQLGLVICEDLWYPLPTAQAAKAGAELVLGINASPYDMYKPKMRERTMCQRAQENQVPLIYLNLVGGQDQLVFDGGSMVVSGQGELLQRDAFYDEVMTPVNIQRSADSHPKISPGAIVDQANVHQRVYEALTLSVRDYMGKNGFPKALVGLSGGIDSALTLAVAADALGPEQVTAVLMPSRYTSQKSLDDAHEQINLLGVHHQTIAIDDIFNDYLQALAPAFESYEQDVTEENIQARIRGVLLMALSNKWHAMVLSTGNKSELSVGYSTLYGDMAGGFCVLKDVPKTLVYELAHYRNQLKQVIPDSIIHKAPSAELAPDQKDQDALPPYEMLDDILERYIEKDQPISAIVEAGYEHSLVESVINRVTRNEYKRRQAPPGVRITARAFGRDRRYPITSKFK